MLSAALKEMSGLKEVTGLFDSRAWGTAVLPTVFTAALATAAAVGLTFLAGKEQPLTDWWNRIEDFGRGLVLAAAGVSVLVAGVVVANVQFALVRFWEGYPADGLAGWLLYPTRLPFWLLSKHAQGDQQERTAREELLVGLLNEATEIDRELAHPDPPSARPPGPAHTPAQVAADRVAADIGRLFHDVYRESIRWWNPIWNSQWTHAKTLTIVKARTGREGDATLASAARRGLRLLRLARCQTAAVGSRLDELRDFLTGLAAEARSRSAGTVVELADLVWQTYQYTPVPPASAEPEVPEPLLPTRLGRAVRAAEAYPLSRYGADAVFFWPRLAPLLPKEFADRFAAAESALALTCTLATFALAVGLPLAGVASGLALAGLVSGAAWWWLVAAPVPAALVLLGFTYRAAADAAEGYAGHIRAAFDLYRWKVLEQMGLKLPPTPDDERETWRLLTHWLLDNARNSSPAHLTYAKKDAAFATPGAGTVVVPVPKAALAAGQPVLAAHLEDKTVPVAALDPGSVTVAAQVVGRTLVTGATAPAGKVVPIGAVVEKPALVAVVVPAATLTALALEPGHTITVSAAPPAAAGAAAPPPDKLAGLIVMSVAEPAAGAESGVFVVAAPGADLDKLTTIIAADRFVVARAL